MRYTLSILVPMLSTMSYSAHETCKSCIYFFIVQDKALPRKKHKIPLEYPKDDTSFPVMPISTWLATDFPYSFPKKIYLPPPP